MATIALRIEYDGSAYVGWQRQPNGVSLQQRLEEALSQVSGAPINLQSSGRTDAGVHARSMVAHFKVDRPLPLKAYVFGTNSLLPPDIAVCNVQQVNDNFHARFSALRKWYRYHLYLSPQRSPLRARYNWLFRRPLNIDLMHEAARAFIGEHDFSAFRAAGCSARTTRRAISAIDLLVEGKQVYIDIWGSGFLRHMVRLMVGALVQVGEGKRLPADIKRMLNAGCPDSNRLSAPAHGLCLMQVEYPPDLLNSEEFSREWGEKGLDNAGSIG